MGAFNSHVGVARAIVPAAVPHTLPATARYACSAATSTSQKAGSQSMIQICRAEDGKIVQVSISIQGRTGSGLTCEQLDYSIWDLER